MELESVFANGFRSKRLIYRAIESNDADKDFIHSLFLDPINMALASPQMFNFSSKKDFLADFDKWAEGAMLKAMICLPTEETDEEAPKTAAMLPGEKIVAQSAKATPIGYLLLGKISDNSIHRRNPGLGIQIHEKYQNKGYGGEAVDWAMDWAFNFANIHKLEIGTSAFNERAAHLYQRLGFKIEGRRRDFFFVNRKWYDLIEMGMLESEYEELRGLK